jgi:2-keto-3-deoxy-L-rhamnonate aldolase RhmA
MTDFDTASEMSHDHRTPPLRMAGLLRQQLRSRARLFGAWMSIGHPEIASILAASRTHFVAIDLEHTTIDLPTAHAIIRACHEYQRPCLPRIYGGDVQQARRLLDAGADGIIVPQVTSRDDVDRMVDVLRYPPDGQRGFGVAAAHQYGRAFEAYVQGANTALSLLVQIESVAGVDAVETIIAHPAVDGVLIGPYDLSGSLGVPGELQHQRVQEACTRVITACAQASMSCGLHVVYPDLDEVRRRLAEGYTLLVLGSDIFNLSQRSRQTDAMIAACQDVSSCTG